AALLVVDAGLVVELLQVEVGLQFAIDARQKIQVESGGNPQLVVIGGQQLRAGFFQIGAEQQRVARLKNVANFRENLHSRRTVEIADRASEKENKQVLPFAPLCGYFQQTVEILTLKADDADGVDIAQFPFAHGQGRRRNFDGIIERTLAAAER